MRTGCMRAGCGLIPGKTTTWTEHSMVQAAYLGWIRHMVVRGQARRASNGASFRAGHGATYIAADLGVVSGGLICVRAVCAPVVV